MLYTFVQYIRKDDGIYILYLVCQQIRIMNTEYYVEDDLSGTLVYDDEWINKTRYLKKFNFLSMLKLLLNEINNQKIQVFLK